MRLLSPNPFPRNTHTPYLNDISIENIYHVYAEPEYGKFYNSMKLLDRFLKDVSASTEGECLEKCYANAKSEGGSFDKLGSC